MISAVKYFCEDSQLFQRGLHFNLAFTILVASLRRCVIKQKFPVSQKRYLTLAHRLSCTVRFVLPSERACHGCTFCSRSCTSNPIRQSLSFLSFIREYTSTYHNAAEESSMNKSISYWQVAGFLFTSIFGSFLHFLFDLSGQSMIASIFSAVNESIWEHMKLIYYPTFLFALVESVFWRKKYKHFWCIKLAGILLELTLIPVIFYTYTGILGISADWFNIAIFFIAAGASFWTEALLFQRDSTCRLPCRMAFLAICLISFVFTVLTFLPPHIPFFKDPITGTYGFQR